MRELSLGIDISDNEAQICFFDDKTDKITSVSYISGENRFVIPILPEEQGQEDFSLLFNRLLGLMKNAVGDFQVENAGISLKDHNSKNLDKIGKTIAFSDVSPKKVSILSHDESFIYFVINQDRSFISGSILLLEYKKPFLNVKRMNVSRKRKPYNIFLNEYKKEMPLDEEAFNDKLYEILSEENRNNRLSVIFIAGDDFGIDAIKKLLINNNSAMKAFYGKNLYANGACYSILDREQVDYEDFRILSDERTALDISLLTDQNGKNTRITLLKAGTNWQAAGAKIQCILDDINKINFVTVAALTGETTNYTIDLSSFPKRQNKTTRVEISIIYISKDRFEITVKDLGFGEFFKSSGKVVKEVLIEDNFI